MPYGKGTGNDNITTPRHGDVVVSNGRAFLTHPRRIEADRDKDTFEQRRSSIQVVELEFSNGWLVANRNKPTYVQIMPAE